MEASLEQLWDKDIEWLFRIKEKYRLRGIKDVIHNMVKVIKVHKLEEELK